MGKMVTKTVKKGTGRSRALSKKLAKPLRLFLASKNEKTALTASALFVH